MNNSENYIVKEIPDIPPAVLDAASRGRLVIFIGAGVSQIVGCPSWQRFAENYLKYLYENKCVTFHEFEHLCKLDARKILSICKNILVEKNLPRPDMKSFLKANDKLIEKYKIFEALYNFNAIYVTTNYDNYLDQIAQRIPPVQLSVSEDTSRTEPIKNRGPKNKVINSTDELLISNLTNGAILHLHGSITDEGGMVITIVDYMEHYERNSKPAVLLEEIFNAYTVLFIGYGLEEYEILEFMISKSLAIKGTLRHFMLFPIFKEEKNLFMFQKKYHADLGIQLVPYSVSENGYEHLATVIQEWAKAISNVSRPQDFLETIKIIDEVI